MIQKHTQRSCDFLGKKVSNYVRWVGQCGFPALWYLKGYNLIKMNKYPRTSFKKKNHWLLKKNRWLFKPVSETIKQVLAVYSSHIFCKTYKSPPGNSCKWISFLAYEQMQPRDKCIHDRYAVHVQFFLTEAAERRELTRQSTSTINWFKQLKKTLYQLLPSSLAAACRTGFLLPYFT